MTYSGELPKNIKIFLASQSDFAFTGREFHSSIIIEVFDLSLTEKIQVNLGKNLSDNPTLAIKQARNRIQDDLEALTIAFKNAVRAQILAEKFGIFRLPAAVVDDELVLYGTTDLDGIITEWLISKDKR